MKRIHQLIGTGGVNYLASPYSHPHPEERAARARAAAYADFLLTRIGHHVFSPIVHGHALTEFGDIGTTWSDWADYDLAML